jgi:hypothetical protein
VGDRCRTHGWVSEYRAYLGGGRSGRGSARDRLPGCRLPLQRVHRAPDDRRYRADRGSSNPSPSEDASENSHSPNQVGENPAQRSAVTRRNDGHHRCSGHGLGLPFVLLMGSCLCHHLSQRLMMRQLMMRNLVGCFVSGFMRLEFMLLELMLFEFVLFEFVLLEFMRQFVLLELLFAEKGTGSLAEDRPERPANRGAHNGRCNFRDSFQERSGAAHQTANAFENLAEELLSALELELVLLEFVRTLMRLEFVRQLRVLEFVRQFVGLEFVGQLRMLEFMRTLVRLELVRQLRVLEFVRQFVGLEFVGELRMLEFMREFVLLEFLFAQQAAEHVPNRAQNAFAFSRSSLVEFLFQFPFGFKIRHGPVLLSK